MLGGMLGGTSTLASTHAARRIATHAARPRRSTGRTARGRVVFEGRAASVLLSNVSADGFISSNEPRGETKERQPKRAPVAAGEFEAVSGSAVAPR
jgi:hypothetical protein